MAVINPPGYLHNLQTHTAQVDRLAAMGLLLPDAVGSLRPKGGVRMLGEYAVTAGSGMSVNVSAGIAYVPQGQSNLGAAYSVPNDGVFNVAIATAPAAGSGLSRNDLIVARVQDSFYAGTNNVGDIIPIQGTAATSPQDPALPAGASYLVLARVLVHAGDTQASQFAITQLAGPAPVVGAAQPVFSTDTTPGLYIGQYRDQPNNGLERWDGSKWSAPNALAQWVEPAVGSATYTVGLTSTAGAWVTVPTLGGQTFSVTVPNGRQLEIEYAAPKLNLSAGGTAFARLMDATGSGTVLDGLEFTGATGTGVPIKLHGFVTGDGLAHPIGLQAWTGSGAAQISGSSGASSGPRFRYRIN